MPEIELGLEDSFLELGVDSLEMMELMCSLEEQFHVTLDLRQVVAAPSVHEIAAYLSDLLNGRTEARATDLRGECVLDGDILPHTCPPEACRHVFVTGTTGFLRAYLIQELIRQRPDVTVYCHDRGATPQALMERIVHNMRRFQCWEEDFRPHIVPVPGDLCQPRLGIAPEDYEKLSQQVEMVIHNGVVYWKSFFWTA